MHVYSRSTAIIIRISLASLPTAVATSCDDEPQQGIIGEAPEPRLVAVTDALEIYAVELGGETRRVEVPASSEGLWFRILDGDRVTLEVLDANDGPMFRGPDEPTWSLAASCDPLTDAIAQFVLDGGLAEADEFFDGLKEAELWDRTTIILTADHGEAFGEHGRTSHGGSAYEEQLHVPLVVRVPGERARAVCEVVSLIDVGPTILDLFGIDTPGTFMGESLVPALRGERPRFARPVAFHTAKRQYGIVFPDRIKAMYSPRKKRKEVYDLTTDPAEEVNLADEVWAQERIATARAFFNAHEFKTPGYKVPGS